MQVKTLLLLFAWLAGVTNLAAQEIIRPRMVSIPAGRFRMGAAGSGEAADQSPVHEVTISHPFLLSATEITNEQYEAFDPGHRKFRGRRGFSKEDDEAVVYIRYSDAVAYCAWLSAREHRLFRLPTEAEWEYACRAGTHTRYYAGDTLPASDQKEQHDGRDPVPVSLRVGTNAPNPWGLYDMHGNVEEWCLDWYGPYTAAPQTDPAGYGSGTARVTRGGSHNTPVRYLESATRLAMLPEDRHWLTGFRVLQSDVFPTPTRLLSPTPGVSQEKYRWRKPADRPFFDPPVAYIIPPDSNSGVPFYPHNHCPAITWLPNGDLLAAWFSTVSESGREMVILGSRLHADRRQWDTASLFFKVSGRNMTGTSLFFDPGTRRLYHINGMAAAGDWQDLAMVMRTSGDNGAHWSAPALIAPEHTLRHQVIAGLKKSSQGWLMQACDAVPGGSGGTVLYLSKDAGAHWKPSAAGHTGAVFKAGEAGDLIAGIHGGFVQLADGQLLALGRGDNIAEAVTGRLTMPLSHSADMGNSWRYRPSGLPPISNGQRLALIRLHEGPLLLLSFTGGSGTAGSMQGMGFKNGPGMPVNGFGLYAALSYDGGITWPVKKLLTSGKPRQYNGGAWTGLFMMDRTHAEPGGYLAVTQAPDNTIHLVSSNLYYRFNLAWLLLNE